MQMSFGPQQGGRETRVDVAVGYVILGGGCFGTRECGHQGECHLTLKEGYQRVSQVERPRTIGNARTVCHGNGEHAHDRCDGWTGSRNSRVGNWTPIGRTLHSDGLTTPNEA